MISATSLDAGSALGPARALLPRSSPVRFLDAEGRPAEDHDGYEVPELARAREAWRRMVVGRRLDAQATALTRQGRLAVYPSSRGQEACQIGAALALGPRDWLFPTYRDTVAVMARGVDPAEALGLLSGARHCGYDPQAQRVAPQCTPLATHAVHAAGYAYACHRLGEDVVALALLGDGATSEGDFHEALNFAGVFRSPVVFLVQNNRYAISVPLVRQTAAPVLAARGAGYGIPAEQVDGNDALAVLSVLGAAMDRARAGGGPSLVEAHTYRVEPHTNADDAGRYRDEAEVEAWRRRDPIARLATWLRAQGALDDAGETEASAEAERAAAGLRSRLSAVPGPGPAALFEHVYAEPTTDLLAQRTRLEAELAQA